MAQEPSFDEILASIKEAQTGSEKPQIRIGEQAVEFDPANASDIQNFLDQQLAERDRREQELRQQVEQLQRRFSIPDEARPQTVNTPAPAPAPAPKPKTPEEIAALQALDTLLADLLGVQGSGSQAIKNVAAMTQLAILQGQEAHKKLATTQHEFFDFRQAQEIDSFTKANPDYEDTDANAAVLENYLKNLRLPPTRQNLELAFLKAQRDGAIGNDQQNQPFTRTNPASARVPSIGRQASPNDTAAMLAAFSELDTDQMEQIMRRFGG